MVCGLWFVVCGERFLGSGSGFWVLVVPETRKLRCREETAAPSTTAKATRNIFKPELYIILQFVWEIGHVTPDTQG